MSKVSYGKLKLKQVNENKKLIYNEQEIEVKQYLPIQDKLNLISDAINQAADGNNFVNNLKLDMFVHLNIVFYYANISFTDNQKSDLIKLYDILESNDLITNIVKLIPSKEYNMILEGAVATAKSIYEYQNSILGILDTVSQDYSQLQYDATNIQKAIADPENLQLLKDVMTKLG